MQGKVVFITDASGGVGETTALVLAAQGAKGIVGTRCQHTDEDCQNKVFDNKANGGNPFDRKLLIGCLGAGEGAKVQQVFRQHIQDF